MMLTVQTRVIVQAAAQIIIQIFKNKCCLLTVFKSFISIEWSFRYQVTIRYQFCLRAYDFPQIDDKMSH